MTRHRLLVRSLASRSCIRCCGRHHTDVRRLATGFVPMRALAPAATAGMKYEAVA